MIADDRSAFGWEICDEKIRIEGFFKGNFGIFHIYVNYWM